MFGLHLLCGLVVGLLLLIPAMLILWWESTQLPDLEEENYTSIEGCNCFLLQCYKYPEKCSLKKGKRHESNNLRVYVDIPCRVW